MITIEEKISVSQDDPFAKQIEVELTKQDGWHMTETTVTTVTKTYKRVLHINIGETEMVRKSGIRYCVCGAEMIATTNGWYCPVCHRTEYL